MDAGLEKSSMGSKQIYSERKNEERKFVKNFRQCPSTVATDLRSGNDVRDNARHYSLLCPLPIENDAMFKRKTL